jgi:predicted aconitase with swiveling domain
MLYEMAARDRAPLALVLNYANPIMAQGAAHADFPLLDRFDCDITAAVKTGDQVTVDPAAGRIIVHE